MLWIDAYPIDATLSEEHALSNEVTSHPVESGADITDHVRARPLMLTVEGVVSDTPIGVVADLRLEDESPSETGLALLERIHTEREPITVETSLRVYQNMVLQSLSIPVDARTGNSIRFRATFQQIQIVTNERTTVRVEVPRAKKKVNLGAKAAAPVTETPDVVGIVSQWGEGNDRSWAKQIVGGF